MPYGGMRRKGASSHQSARVSLMECCWGGRNYRVNLLGHGPGRSLRPVARSPSDGATCNHVAVIRRWSDRTGTHRGVIAINRNTAESRTTVLPWQDLPSDPRVYWLCREDAAVGTVPAGEVLPLAPAEVVMIGEALSTPRNFLRAMCNGDV